MNRVPRDPKQCSWCVESNEPCENHRGPDGSPVDYTGSDAYELDGWPKEVVGQVYTADHRPNGPFLCFGYDPRHGFWMRSQTVPIENFNVSERAIDRVFFKVRGVSRDT